MASKMRAIDRLKWASYCGYNPYREWHGDCSGIVHIKRNITITRGSVKTSSGGMEAKHGK